MAVGCENLGDQRAGNAGADNEDVGEFGAVELGLAERGEAPGLPGGAPRAEVAVNGYQGKNSYVTRRGLGSKR